MPPIAGHGSPAGWFCTGNYSIVITWRLRERR